MDCTHSRWRKNDESTYMGILSETSTEFSKQNMAVKLVERNVQCVWLKAGQEFFIGDIYSVSEAPTRIVNGL